MKLDEQQLATVLAALRYWQREGLMSNGDEHDIATEGGRYVELGAEAIDELCEELNCYDELTIVGADEMCIVTAGTLEHGFTFYGPTDTNKAHDLAETLRTTGREADVVALTDPELA